MTITNVAPQANVAKAESFKCPGHSELTHRYLIEKKANKKAQAALEKLKENKEISTADFKVVAKKDAQNLEKALFKGLNGVFFNYAVVMNYTHADNSADCPLNPTNKA